MLKLAPGSRIFMAVKPVDMRRSFDGLCATITEALGGDPLSGDVFLFRGKRADRIKAIAWDRTGLAIWYKRLEKGKYKWPTRDAASIEMTEHELALLVDGVDFTRIRRLPAFSYPTDVKTLHFMLDEQRQLIESLKANLHRLLKWQFGPKSEHLNVDQLGLFVDGSVVIEVPAAAPADHTERSNTSPVTSERRRAVRVLRNLPRVIEEIDVPEAQKTCPCCGEALTAFGHEASEQLHYIPARLEVHETRRRKYSCGHCHGSVVRALVPAHPPIPKSMASASLLAYLIVSKFADGLPLYRIAGRLRRLGIELSHTLMSE